MLALIKLLRKLACKQGTCFLVKSITVKVQSVTSKTAILCVKLQKAWWL